MFEEIVKVKSRTSLSSSEWRGPVLSQRGVVQDPGVCETVFGVQEEQIGAAFVLQFHGLARLKWQQQSTPEPFL